MPMSPSGGPLANVQFRDISSTVESWVLKPGVTTTFIVPYDERWIIRQLWAHCGLRPPAPARLHLTIHDRGYDWALGPLWDISMRLLVEGQNIAATLYHKLCDVGVGGEALRELHNEAAGVQASWLKVLSQIAPVLEHPLEARSQMDLKLRTEGCEEHEPIEVCLYITKSKPVR